jgi:hypothetical protein
MKLAHHWGINGVCARCLATRDGNDSAICSGRKTARQAARDREPLDGADAQALEGALTMTERELAAAEERNRELVRERDELQEELGRLRWGMTAKDETAQWYVIDPENCVEIHATAEEAQADAEACLEHLRDCSVDGWHEDVQSLQWGRLVPYQWTCQTDLREAPEGSDHDYLCDYVLTTVK